MLLDLTFQPQSNSWSMVPPGAFPLRPSALFCWHLRSCVTQRCVPKAPGYSNPALPKLSTFPLLGHQNILARLAGHHNQHMSSLSGRSGTSRAWAMRSSRSLADTSWPKHVQHTTGRAPMGGHGLAPRPASSCGDGP